MMERFVDDDKGFQAWLGRHWRGYVVKLQPQAATELSDPAYN